MNSEPQIQKANWRSLGEAPDYRFSLANERTYLAWIRTAVALLAGAIAIDQLTPDLAEPVIRILISTFLCLCSGIFALFAYRRWAANERAMRNKHDLPYTNFLKVSSAVVIVLTTAVVLAINL
ncbi:YidH family protein [Psychromonas sp.]|uniref:YidH family protein n=1 Tax=Psychromonas sp. TaxID=1884585 RepID=UPI00356B19C2